MFLHNEDKKNSPIYLYPNRRHILLGYYSTLVNILFILFYHLIQSALLTAFRVIMLLKCKFEMQINILQWFNAYMAF